MLRSSSSSLFPCCLLAVRWAVRQFESESVMFRESERFHWSRWLQYIWRHRAATATPNEALLCGTIILVALFFGRLSASSEMSWESIARSTLAIQIAMILGPCLIMATFMTASMRHALRIEWARPIDLVLCFVLGLTLHPAYTLLSAAVQHEFQISPDTHTFLMQIETILRNAPYASVIVILAVVPALCEELTFRGFIFGGLIKQNGTLRAILLSSVFFGLSHGVLQQTITATLMGCILGIIAWRSGGVLCGIVVHMTHNALTMTLARLNNPENSIPSWCSWAITKNPEGAVDYQPT